MKLDAENLARSWLSVALASGKDEVSQLNRTVAVEQFHNGVRLVATDGYILLTSWVGADWLYDSEPSLDEAPMCTAIAIDRDGRAKGLLAHALKLCAQAEKEEQDRPLIRLDLGVTIVEDDDSDDGQMTFAGMEPRWAVIEIPDVERVKLRLYDGEYPNWRRVVAGFEAETTSVIALNPERVASLAKIAKYHPRSVLAWEFGGADRMARVTADGSEPRVEGVIMPCRWDMQRNEPRPDDVVEDGGEDAEGES